MIRRERRLAECPPPPADTPPKPISPDVVLRDVVLPPTKLPTPWLYDSENLLNDLDRVRECVLRIPLTLEAHGPINVALCAVRELRERLSLLDRFTSYDAGRLESTCERNGKTRAGRNHSSPNGVKVFP